MSKLIDRAITSAAAAIVGLVLTSVSASAQGGTAAERTACMTDAMTLCSSAIPDEGRIEACLRRQSARISPACRTVLNPAATVERVAVEAARRNGGR